MVFATSLDDPDTGYALTLEEIGPAVPRRGRDVPRVDGCLRVRLRARWARSSRASSQTVGSRRRRRDAGTDAVARARWWPAVRLAGASRPALRGS